MRQVTSRMRVLAILGIITVFALGYGVIGYTHHYSSWNLTTSLDNAIPFIPAFIVFYFIGDIYLFTPVFIVKDERKFQRMMLGFFAILTIAYICFLAFPIELPKKFVYDKSLFAALVQSQHASDTTFNNFPSLHVALNMYAWLILSEEKKKIFLWTTPVVLGIILSVLLVKQHLIIDVFGGATLAAGTFWWWRKY